MIGLEIWPIIWRSWSQLESKTLHSEAGAVKTHFQNCTWWHIDHREERLGPQRPVTNILRRNNEVLSQGSNEGKKRES